MGEITVKVEFSHVVALENIEFWKSYFNSIAYGVRFSLVSV